MCFVILYLGSLCCDDILIYLANFRFLAPEIGILYSSKTIDRWPPDCLFMLAGLAALNCYICLTPLSVITRNAFYMWINWRLFGLVRRGLTAVISLSTFTLSLWFSRFSRVLSNIHSNRHWWKSVLKQKTLSQFKIMDNIQSRMQLFSRYKDIL